MAWGWAALGPCGRRGEGSDLPLVLAAVRAAVPAAGSLRAMSGKENRVGLAARAPSGGHAEPAELPQGFAPHLPTLRTVSQAGLGTVPDAQMGDQATCSPASHSGWG